MYCCLCFIQRKGTHRAQHRNVVPVAIAAAKVKFIALSTGLLRVDKRRWRSLMNIVPERCCRARGLTRYYNVRKGGGKLPAASSRWKAAIMRLYWRGGREIASAMLLTIPQSASFVEEVTPDVLRAGGDDAWTLRCWRDDHFIERKNVRQNLSVLSCRAARWRARSMTGRCWPPDAGAKGGLFDTYAA